MKSEIEFYVQKLFLDDGPSLRVLNLVLVWSYFHILVLNNIYYEGTL